MNKLRKLDLEIAKKIMGWRKSDKLLSASDGTTYIRFTGMCERWEDDHGPYSFLFNPTENISDAFQIVEKLRSKFEFSLDNMSYENPIGGYRAIFLSKKRHEACEETAPLAICNAALETLK